MLHNSQQVQSQVLTNAAGEQVTRSDLEQYRDDNNLAGNNDTTFGDDLEGFIKEKLPSLGTDQNYLNVDKTFTDNTSKLQIYCHDHSGEEPNNTTETAVYPGGNLVFLQDIMTFLQNTVGLLSNNEYGNGAKIKITAEMSDVLERIFSYESTFDEESTVLGDITTMDGASAQ